MVKTKTATRKKNKVASKSRPRRTLSKIGREMLFESDSTYLLKLVIIVIIGAVWLQFNEPAEGSGFAIKGIPIGLFAGILGVKLFERHQADRKIWYVVLIIVGIISAWLPVGILI